MVIPALLATALTACPQAPAPTPNVAPAPTQEQQIEARGLSTPKDMMLHGILAGNSFQSNQGFTLQNGSSVHANTGLILNSRNIVLNGGQVSSTSTATCSDNSGMGFCLKGKPKFIAPMVVIPKADIPALKTKYSATPSITIQGNLNLNSSSEISTRFDNQIILVKGSVNLNAVATIKNATILVEETLSSNKGITLENTRIISKGIGLNQATKLNNSRIITDEDLTVNGTLESIGISSLISSKNITTNQTTSSINGELAIIANQNMTINQSSSGKIAVWANGNVNLNQVSSLEGSVVAGGKVTLNQRVTLTKVLQHVNGDILGGGSFENIPETLTLTAGATIRFQNGVVIKAPIGSFDGSVNITVTEVPKERATIPLPSNMEAVAKYYTIRSSRTIGSGEGFVVGLPILGQIAPENTTLAQQYLVRYGVGSTAPIDLWGTTVRETIENLAGGSLVYLLAEDYLVTAVKYPVWNMSIQNFPRINSQKLCRVGFAHTNNSRIVTDEDLTVNEILESLGISSLISSKNITTNQTSSSINGELAIIANQNMTMNQSSSGKIAVWANGNVNLNQVSSLEGSVVAGGKVTLNQALTIKKVSSHLNGDVLGGGLFQYGTREEGILAPNGVFTTSFGVTIRAPKSGFNTPVRIFIEPVKLSQLPPPPLTYGTKLLTALEPLFRVGVVGIKRVEVDNPNDPFILTIPNYSNIQGNKAFAARIYPSAFSVNSSFPLRWNLDRLEFVNGQFEIPVIGFYRESMQMHYGIVESNTATKSKTLQEPPRLKTQAQVTQNFTALCTDKTGIEIDCPQIVNSRLLVIEAQYNGLVAVMNLTDQELPKINRTIRFTNGKQCRMGFAHTNNSRIVTDEDLTVNGTLESLGISSLISSKNITTNQTSSSTTGELAIIANQNMTMNQSSSGKIAVWANGNVNLNQVSSLEGSVVVGGKVTLNQRVTLTKVLQHVNGDVLGGGSFENIPETLTLTAGATIRFQNGVVIKAPIGSFDGSVNITVTEVPKERATIPLPSNMEAVAKYYTIRSSRTIGSGEGFVVGLPILGQIAPENTTLVEQVLFRYGVGSTVPIDLWSTTVRRPFENLSGGSLVYLLAEDYLVTAVKYPVGNIVVPGSPIAIGGNLRTQAANSNPLQIETVQCDISNALLNINTCFGLYGEIVEALSTFTRLLNLTSTEAPIVKILEVKSANDPVCSGIGGGYLRQKIIICVKSDLSVTPGVSAHEVFHAVQEQLFISRRLTFAYSNSNFWIIESTAEAAAFSRETMQASERQFRFPIEKKISDNTSMGYKYQLHDFWVFAGKKLGKGVKFLKDLFLVQHAQGDTDPSTTNLVSNFRLVDTFLKNQGYTTGLSGAYSDWVRSYFIERKIPIRGDDTFNNINQFCIPFIDFLQSQDGVKLSLGLRLRMPVAFSSIKNDTSLPFSTQSTYVKFNLSGQGAIASQVRIVARSSKNHVKFVVYERQRGDPPNQNCFDKAESLAPLVTKPGSPDNSFYTFSQNFTVTQKSEFIVLAINSDFTESADIQFRVEDIQAQVAVPSRAKSPLLTLAILIPPSNTNNTSSRVTKSVCHHLSLTHPNQPQTQALERKAYHFVRTPMKAH